MIPGINEDFDRICLQVAAVLVSALTAYAFGMLAMRGVVMPEMLFGAALAWAVLVGGWIHARRAAA